VGDECARNHEIQPLPKDTSSTTPWMEEVEQCRSNCRELGGTGRKFWHLSWGDLRHESAGEVSRGRSSEEVPVMGVERRAEESGSLIQTRLTGSEQYSETSGRCCGAANHPFGDEQEARWIPCGTRIAGCKPRLAVKGERE
jgi:hypothetical protein